MTDILLIGGLDEWCFALVDIDAQCLDLAQQIAERLIAHSGKRWSVRASTERRDVVLATWDIRSGNKHFENDIIFFHC